VAESASHATLLQDKREAAYLAVEPSRIKSFCASTWSSFGPAEASCPIPVAVARWSANPPLPDRFQGQTTWLSLVEIVGHSDPTRATSTLGFPILKPAMKSVDTLQLEITTESNNCELMDAQRQLLSEALASENNHNKTKWNTKDPYGIDSTTFNHKLIVKAQGGPRPPHRKGNTDYLYKSIPVRFRKLLGV